MQDAAAGMPPLQGHGDVVLRVPVEIDVHLFEQPQHILRPLVDQDFQAAQIIFIPAGDQRVRDMETEIVVFFVHHRSNPPLGQALLQSIRSFFDSTSTRTSGAKFSAAYNPATPLPAIRTS